MHSILYIALVVSALYCAGMWLYLAAYSLRSGQNLEPETFHLGLCFILAVGALYLG